MLYDTAFYIQCPNSLVVTVNMLIHYTLFPAFICTLVTLENTTICVFNGIVYLQLSWNVSIPEKLEIATSAIASEECRQS